MKNEPDILDSAPYAPFPAKQAELGKELVTKSLEIRKQITDMSAPADPFKIMGNLYFVGVANGEAYLLTSPQGHILMGSAMEASQERVQKNIESLGFKMTDIKAILLNHNHEDQSGGAAYMKEKSGAQVMAGFAEISAAAEVSVNQMVLVRARTLEVRGSAKRTSPPPCRFFAQMVVQSRHTQREEHEHRSDPHSLAGVPPRCTDGTRAR